MADQQEVYPYQEKHEKQKKRSGKRKIEKKRIANKTSRQVAFSKRKGGVFKKASKLCSLCGAQVAVIAFSGAGKPFSFGHPSAEDIVYRYINFLDYQNPKIENCGDGNSNSNAIRISSQYKEVLSSIDLDKKRTNEVGSSLSNGSSPQFWWDVPIDDSMGLNELEQLKVALERLRVEVTSRIDEINNNNRSLTSVFPNDFGSTDGNNINAVANRGYENSCWNKNNDHGAVIRPSYSPMMMNSMYGHSSENLGIFQ
ncbi:Agamous-like MADS-box protein AGL61 [Bienertia sinuspersici]